MFVGGEATAHQRVVVSSLSSEELGEMSLAPGPGLLMLMISVGRCAWLWYGIGMVSVARLKVHPLRWVEHMS